MNRPLQILICAATLCAWPVAAAAQERLCDTQNEDCRTPLINLIRNEPPTGGIDVAFWFMQDARYSQELINRHRAGVPIRIIVDQQANNTKPGNAEIIADLAAAGIPMRHRAVGDILHFKMMLFHGQGVVQFSKANYTPYSFVPESPTNYFDETIFFTDDVADLALTNSFRRRFDDLWIDTTRYQNFANITGTPTRRYAPFPIDGSMNFPPLENFQTRAFGRFNAENQGIDAIVYRITDSLLPNALIDAATNRRVRVRVISEPQQYRDLDKRWHAAHMDRLYMAGVQIKHRHYDGLNYAGLMHQGSVVLHGLGEVIFGSSNWTSASANRQDEHNYFYRPVPGKEKLWFFQFFVDQFEDKFTRDTLNNYEDFRPLPPDPLTAYLSPGNGASGVSTSPTLTWEGGPWAHLYDVYLGTSPTALALVGPPNQQLGSPNNGSKEIIGLTDLQPGTTYFWRIVSKTWALQSRTGPVWSFTTAGTPPGGGGGIPYGGTPAAIPGTFQAENFDEGGQFVGSYDTTTGNKGGVYRTNTDVDIGTTNDGGSAIYVGWTKAGEWLKYTVNVQAAGTYSLQTRLAQVGTGGRFHIEVGSSYVSGPITVPNTGAWDAWQTITTPGIQLPAGVTTIRVVLDAVGTGGAVAGFNWFQLASGSSPPTPPTTTPYGGTPAAIPGVVQAEHFDEGGQSLAYFDTTAGNKGAYYRLNTDVDIGQTNDGGTAPYVGWTKAGEWLKYTVNVATAGTYSFHTRLAQVGTGGRFHIEVGTSYVSGPITVPDTGAWDAWQTITTPGIPLPAGVTTIRVVFDAVGTGGAVAGFNWFQLTSGSASAGTTPFGGTAAAIPGVMQAENFDEGGQSLAYFDTTAGNRGDYYRVNTDVDIGQTNDGGTAAYVGWTKAGEWLKYTVDVATAGSYSLQTRLAQVGTGGQFHVEVGTAYVSGAITVPDTGAWDAWQTVSTPGVPLAAGQQVIKFVFDAIGTGGAVAGFNWFELVGPTS